MKVSCEIESVGANYKGDSSMANRIGVNKMSKEKFPKLRYCVCESIGGEIEVKSFLCATRQEEYRAAKSCSCRVILITYDRDIAFNRALRERNLRSV